MKLYLMKQSALDYMKANMATLYKNYFQFDSPEWIYNLFDYDPFELFMTIDDFDLANLNQKEGEIDFQNCKIIYEKLKDFSDSQACDERLWAGLCNKTFYEYVRKRWELAKRHLRKTSDDASAITSAFFYKSSGRGGMFRNTLGRLWWTGRLTYLENSTNHWEQLDAIGSEDISSKISMIFYSYTFSSNTTIIEGICRGFKFFRDRDIRLIEKEHIRPTMQYLNALGGGMLLDMMSADEIYKEFTEHIGGLMNGKADVLLAIDEEFEEADPFEEEADAEEINIDFDDFCELMNVGAVVDVDEVLGELEVVEYGCKIHIQKSPEGSCFISQMPVFGEKLNMLQKRFLGKNIGEAVFYNGSNYTIIDIKR